jgi:hypothetical protein
MSSPHVIISAVHELKDEDPKHFWNDNKVRDVVDKFDKEVWDDEWNMTTAKFKSNVMNETFEIETPYHSNRRDNVVEIVIDGAEKIQDISITGLEKLIQEINERFKRDFTLEAYYWYDGVDKPGGVPR